MSRDRGASMEFDELLGTFMRAGSDDLEVLAFLHDLEPQARLLQSLKDSRFPLDMGFRLTTEAGRKAVESMRDALADIDDPTDAGVLDVLAADYSDIYLTHGLRASPYESVWLDEEQLQRQEPMFQVRKWYRRHDLAAGNWRDRADDHLVLELQFVSKLLESGTGYDALTQIAQFMDEHLLRWLARFANLVQERASTAYFAAVASLTAAYCDELRDLIATLTGVPRPSLEDIDARMKPKSNGKTIPVQFVPGLGPAL